MTRGVWNRAARRGGGNRPFNLAPLRFRPLVQRYADALDSLAKIEPTIYTVDRVNANIKAALSMNDHTLLPFVLRAENLVNVKAGEL